MIATEPPVDLATIDAGGSIEPSTNSFASERPEDVICSWTDEGPTTFDCVSDDSRHIAGIGLHTQPKQSCCCRRHDSIVYELRHGKHGTDDELTLGDMLKNTTMPPDYKGSRLSRAPIVPDVDPISQPFNPSGTDLEPLPLSCDISMDKTEEMQVFSSLCTSSLDEEGDNASSTSFDAVLWAAFAEFTSAGNIDDSVDLVYEQSVDWVF